MRRIIRLTEKDVTRLVRKVINESLGSGKAPFAFSRATNKWYDSSDYEVDEPTDFYEEKEFGPEDYDSFMEYINNCNTKWCITTKRMYDMYANHGGIKVRK